MNLVSIDTHNLKHKENACGCELRKDLHSFVDYCRQNQVKRSHRENAIPKGDIKKLAKFVTNPQVMAEFESRGWSRWIDFIDQLSRLMGLVIYDTKGQYMGYTSQEPSFPDNYIKVALEKYEKFLTSPLAQQEQSILEHLVKTFSYSNNEFFVPGVLGELDGFDQWGCATAVLPTLNFQEIREFLLSILASCERGKWFSTDALVAHLKETHPYFLIPAKFKTKYLRENSTRYDNFREKPGGKPYGEGKVINFVDPDAFERVEGRYVERFLEGIPLVLGYVDVAYDPDLNLRVCPSIGRLKAFRVRDRLVNVVKRTIPDPRVWIQSNFEIYVESDLYPAPVLAQLKPLADLIKEDRVTILRLKKEKVAAAMAQDASLDVPTLLKSLIKKELPPNVAVELAAWGKHADMFTLYEGFSLLESSEAPAAIDNFIRERIAPRLSIVHSPVKLFDLLEKEELVPLSMAHEATRFKELPAFAKTVFRTITQATKKAPPKKIAVKRKTSFTYAIPDDNLIEVFRQKLTDAGCPFQLNKSDRAITLSLSSNAHFLEIMKKLKGEFAIQVEDLE